MQVQALVVIAPGRGCLPGPFENDEVKAGSPEACPDGEAGRPGSDHGDGCLFAHPGSLTTIP
jgi:hypothetical protein